MNAIKIELTENAVGIIVSGTESDLKKLHDALRIATREVLSNPDRVVWENNGLMYLVDLYNCIAKAYGGLGDDCYSASPFQLDEEFNVIEVLVHSPGDPKNNELASVVYSELPNKEGIYSTRLLLPFVIKTLHILESCVSTRKEWQASHEVIRSFKTNVLNAIGDCSNEVSQFVDYWLSNTKPFSKNYIYGVAWHLASSDYIQFRMPDERLESLPEYLKSIEEDSEPYLECADFMRNLANTKKIKLKDLYLDFDRDVLNSLNNGVIQW